MDDQLPTDSFAEMIWEEPVPARVPGVSDEPVESRPAGDTMTHQLDDTRGALERDPGNVIWDNAPTDRGGSQSVPLNPGTERRSVSDRLRSRSMRVAGAILSLALVASPIVAAKSLDGGNKTPAAVAPHDTDYVGKKNLPKLPEHPQSVDINKDGMITGNEQVTPDDIAEVLNSKDLPAILNIPFISKDEAIGLKRWYSPATSRMQDTSEIIKGYNGKFIGAYQAVGGMKLNIYATAQDGQESALNQKFQINPESIEYLLKQIGDHIGDAPENSAKAAMIQSLSELRSGQDDRVVQLAIDMSPQAGCLDAKNQLIALSVELCKSGGINMTPWIPTNDAIVVIASGKKLLYDNPDRSLHEATTSTAEMHELMHALAPGGRPDNSNHEGDTEHEVIDWLTGDKTLDGSYDYVGAGPSPKVGDKIEKLVRAGYLQPILTVAA